MPGTAGLVGLTRLLRMMSGTATTSSVGGSHPASKPGHPDDWWMILVSAYPRGSLAAPQPVEAVKTLDVDGWPGELTCPEVETICGLFRVVGAPETADALLANHAYADDVSDAHFHLNPLAADHRAAVPARRLDQMASEPGTGAAGEPTVRCAVAQATPSVTFRRAAVSMW
jgi:hypothetical protein